MNIKAALLTALAVFCIIGFFLLLIYAPIVVVWLLGIVVGLAVTLGIYWKIEEKIS